MMATNFVVHLVCFILGIAVMIWIFRLQQIVHALRSCFQAYHVIDWVPLAMQRVARTANADFECSVALKSGSPRKLRLDRILTFILKLSIQKLVFNHKGLTLYAPHAIDDDIVEMCEKDLGISITVQYP